MPRIEINTKSIQEVIFSDEEANQAYIFSDLQILHIQNEIAVALTYKMGIAMDPESANPEKKYLIDHEYFRGKISALEELLITHLRAQNELVEFYQEQQAHNPILNPEDNLPPDPNEVL